MQIKIVNSGMLSTVQDLGRRDFLPQAVPVSGAMDNWSARVANLCLGNNESDAVIELTFAGAWFTTETEVLIVYTGKGGVWVSEGVELPSHTPIFIPAGKTLTLRPKDGGCRTYLAIAGGWDVPLVLESRSTLLMAEIGGFEGRALKCGDVLSGSPDLNSTTGTLFNQLKADQINFFRWRVADDQSNITQAIRVIPAREWDWFEPQSRDAFFTTDYRLNTNSNRMGYRLDGPAVKRINQNELLSTAVVPGTIQITGNGSPILLIADCQTTGGYPRIAQVAAVDMNRCGQLKPGDSISFTPITINEAEKLYIEQEKEWRKLASSVKFNIDRSCSQ